MPSLLAAKNLQTVTRLLINLQTAHRPFIFCQFFSKVKPCNEQIKLMKARGGKQARWSSQCSVYGQCVVCCASTVSVQTDNCGSVQCVVPVQSVCRLTTAAVCSVCKAVSSLGLDIDLSAHRSLRFCTAGGGGRGRGRRGREGGGGRVATTVWLSTLHCTSSQHSVK